MKVRTVLYAEDDMVLTNGTDYGKVIWLAEGGDPDMYYSISQIQYDSIQAELDEQNKKHLL